MTAPPAALCGHRWEGARICRSYHVNGFIHRCQLDAGHTDRCRCRCGALTPEETTR